MTENSQKELDELRRTVQHAVMGDDYVQQSVRDITLKALGEGELDRRRIKAVAEAVMQGAGDAVAREGEHLKQSLGEAAAGLEQALIQAADAFRLAIEEAAGRVSEFSANDLKRSLDDLESLEGIFTETLQRIADSGGDLVRTIAGDMAAHAHNSGTSVGQHVARNMEQLQNRLRELGADGAEAGGEVVNRIGQIARGILAGVAQTLLDIAEGEKERRSGGS